MDLMNITNETLRKGRLLSKSDTSCTLMLPLCRLNYVNRLRDPRTITQGKHAGGKRWEFQAIFNVFGKDQPAYIDFKPTFNEIRELLLGSKICNDNTPAEKIRSMIAGPYGVFKKDAVFSKGARQGEFKDRAEDGTFNPGYGPHTIYRDFTRPDTKGPLEIRGIGKKILSPEVIKSGDYAQVIADFYVFTVDGTKSVYSEFQAIQMVAKGEPLFIGQERPKYGDMFEDHAGADTFDEKTEEPNTGGGPETGGDAFDEFG